MHFDSWNIDNNAIHIVIDQLLPFLRRDAYEGLYVLDLDHDSIEEKHLAFYEEIFEPYRAERQNRNNVFHPDGAPDPDSWYGNQASLSMIHYLNQKAWWMLHFYAVKETVQKHLKVKSKKLDEIACFTTYNILDGNVNVADAVNWQITEILNIDKRTEKIIIEDITEIIECYKKEPSHPMTYR